MKLIPYNYQEEAINRALKINLLLADNCGLGKTLVAIETYLRLLNGSALFITRKNSKYQLKHQILNQDEHAVVYVINKVKDFKYEIFENSPIHTYCIIHYQLLIKLFNETSFFNIMWGFIVADEAHMFKNRLTKKAIYIYKLKGKRKLALTATPTNKKFLEVYNNSAVLLYNPAELWSLFKWLHPKNFTSYQNFYNRFMQLDYEKGYKKEIGIHDIETFVSILNQILLKRTKKQVAPHLPDLIVTKVILPLQNTQYKLYEALKQACKEDIIVNVEGLTPKIITNHLTVFTELHKLASYPVMNGSNVRGIKLAWLEEFIESNDDNILVVSRYRAVINYLSGKYNCDVVIGGFNTLKTGVYFKLIVGTIKALAGALDLGYVDHVVFIDQTYSTIDMEQVLHRVHRINITTPKTAYYLVLENTVDELVIEALENQWDIEVLIQYFINHIKE